MSKRTTPAAEPAPLMKRTNFFMPVEMHAGLKTMARNTGDSEAEHVRKAVSAYLKRNKVLEAAH